MLTEEGGTLPSPPQKEVNFFSLFILAAPGLSCSTRDLHCGMRDLLVAAGVFLVAALQEVNLSWNVRGQEVEVMDAVPTARFWIKWKIIGCGVFSYLLHISHH